MTKCDRCGSIIQAQKCSHTVCFTKADIPEYENLEEFATKMVEGLRAFAAMHRPVYSVTDTSTGCSAVYFQGDYDDCKKIEHLLHVLKNRPYYAEEPR